jgi:GWxTD domain-containing protein
MDCEVTVGTRRAMAPVHATMIWPDQPESLRDVEYALESLRFIAPPHVLDSLQSGSFEARRDRLEQFWKERAGQRATADNPLMTEYYRRVDFAREHFATLKQQDGTRTDRGKIYILNGPPSQTDRTLDPVNGFTEIWTYERSKKRIVFLDKNRDGNYSLVTTGSL